MRMIIADASPLIMLARSGLIDVLRVLAGKVIVPEAVWNECIGGGARPGATAILSARQTGHIEVRADAVLNDPLPALGAGEVSAIALAMELGCPVLMDERLGRRVASLHGVWVIGSAAILIAAKERGLTPAVKPVLLDWRAAGNVFSEALLRAVLQRAGEE
jgi:predicted nucleic acid-binding protein